MKETKGAAAWGTFKAHGLKWQRSGEGLAGAPAASAAPMRSAACPAPAHPERGARGAPARGRAARRLRRLAQHGLTQTERSHAHDGAAASAAPTLTLEPQGAGPEHRACLAARALSQMLCDEPHAARCRATVRCARMY